MSRFVVGIDIGATNTRAGLVALDGLKVIREERFVTRSAGGFAGFIERLYATLRLLEETPAAVGIGVAGLVDSASGSVLYSPNLPGWRNAPLGPELSRLSGVPVWIDNDANMAALGEQRAGAAVGLGHLICLTLGTGVGGGLVLNGEIYTGARGQAGEVGHMVIESGGALCNCGHRGCLETIASATGLLRMAREGMAKGEETSLAPEDLSARSIAAAARAEDRFALDLYARLGRALGFVTANICNLLDLDAAVLTGGVAAAWDLFIPHLHSELELNLLPLKNFRVLRGTLGDTAGILGAACLALGRLEQA
ncbi:MAG: ROK family protein [Pseudomonadota bacterium]